MAVFTDRSPVVHPYLDLLFGARKWGRLQVEEWPGVRPLWLLRRAKKDDILHLGWPSYHYGGASRWRFLKGLARYSLFLLLVRLRRTKIVWMAHNLYPHDMKYRRLEWLGRVVTLAFANAVIAHDQRMLDAVKHEFCLRRPGYVVPHMSYVGVYRDTIRKEEARLRLGIPSGAFVFLVFGLIRPYKGIDAVIAAFRRSRRPSDRLIVAGWPFDGEYARKIQQLIAADPQIICDFRKIPEEDLATLMKASDVVVSAGRGQYTSGATMIALSFGRPVIASRNCAPASVRDGFAATLYDPADAEALPRAMAEAPARFNEDRSVEIAHCMTEVSPDKVARRFVEVLRKICAGQGVRKPWDAHRRKRRTDRTSASAL